MATVEMTEKNFEEIVASNDVVLIDFWAAWCGPCRSFAPIFEKVSQEYPDAVFGKVDTEAQQGLAASFNIMSIPTLMIIRENVVLFSQAGALPEKALVDVVEKVLSLDMQEVHRQVLAQQGADS
jgi:thioredoxin 1